jgi:hypothetical protein
LVFSAVLLTSVILAGWFAGTSKRAHADERKADPQVGDSIVELAANEPTHRALLVGCTRYPSLVREQQLRGAANDVVITRKLLIEKFGFVDQNIKTLAEAEGKASWPTSENIKLGFEWLIRESAVGDHVFILLSGHGSQQPDLDRNLEVDFEPDGRDETFLPRDIGAWNSEKEHVENAITDDTFRKWIAALVSKEVFVFFVADSCHSGTLCRGEADKISRRVLPNELGVPNDLPDTPDAFDHGDSERPNCSDWLDLALDGDNRGVVALYAAQDKEKAYEIPPQKDRPSYGRLTYSLYEACQRSSRPITYRELSQRILWTYTKRGWIRESTPYIKGTDLSREVLGVSRWPPSFLQITEDGGQYKTGGGFLHGVTVGSILGVYPVAGARHQDELVGYVEVTQSGPFSSLAVPVNYGNRPPSARLPDPGRCKLVHRGLGDMKLTVDVVCERIRDEQQADLLRNKVLGQLRELAQMEDALIRLRDGSHVPNWYAVVTGKGLYLQRADSTRAPGDPDAVRVGEVCGPHPIDEDLDSWLRERLHKIARVTNLVKLAEEFKDLRDPTINVELAVTLNGEAFDPLDGTQAEVRHQDLLELWIRNSGLVDMSVVVFYVDNAFAIIPFFPISARDSYHNRIPKWTELSSPVKFRINDRTLGWENVLVIAVNSKDEGLIDELLLLQQGGFAVRCGAGGERAIKSPLGRLVEDVMNGRARSPSAMDIPPLDSYAIRRISWKVVAGRR